MSNIDDMENIFNEAAAASSPAVNPTTRSVPPPPTPSQINARKANEVFADTSRVKEMSREDYARNELGIDIPIDAVPLPSRGLVYPVSDPLHCVDHVEYRAMTAREEDILMSRALIKKGTMISELIKSCIMNKGINVGNLLSGDRLALMVAIRVSGYGKEYNQSFECPKCQHRNQLDTDLAELPIKSLELDPIQLGSNLFSFTLPITNRNLVFKFLTVSDEERITHEMEARKKRGMLNDNFVTTKLLSSIVSIDGDENRGNIQKFVQNMPAMDSRAFRKYIDENEPGLKMEVEFQCASCDYLDNIALPIGSEFFWPDTK